MSNKIKINGKEYNIRVTLGSAKKIFRKYNIDEATTWTQSDWFDYSSNLIWQTVQPRIFFKPFIFFSRFSNKISVDELTEAVNVINGIMYGESKEDKEEGN